MGRTPEGGLYCCNRLTLSHHSAAKTSAKVEMTNAALPSNCMPATATLASYSSSSAVSSSAPRMV